MATADELESTDRFLKKIIPDWKPEHTLTSKEIEDGIAEMKANNQIATEHFTYLIN